MNERERERERERGYWAYADLRTSARRSSKLPSPARALKGGEKEEKKNM